MPSSVVIIAPAMHSGGSVGAVAWRHALELAARHKVHVITRDIPEDGGGALHVHLVRPWTWTWLRRFGHVPAELAFLRAARVELAALCQRERIDVVWCHGHALMTMVAAPLKDRFGFGAVMTTHGDIFDRPAGTYSRDLTWFYRRVTPPAYRDADYVHVPSPYMGECAVRGGTPPGRVRLMPHGIDSAEIGAGTLSPREPASFMPGGVLRLLYVGSMLTVKGVDVLLHAVAQLAFAGASQPVELRLTLIGEGGARTELEKLAATLGIAGQVVFRGPVARGELLPHYREADIVCVPSRSEALSLAALEAMLCGSPVVGSDTGGIPYLVDDGVTGHLAAPGNSTELADCLRKAASSREHLADLGAGGFAKARSIFTWAGISAQLDGLAREAASLRSPMGPVG